MLTTDITAGPGGVMTDEVGVVTGALTLRTDTTPTGSTVLMVQYKGAAEWYTVTGSRVPTTDTAALHTLAVGLLNRPDG